jgi:hypothetical protein
MKTWVKQLRNYLSGRYWKPYKWEPTWFDHHVLGYSRTRYYLNLQIAPKAGYSNDTLKKNVADLISTYILPYCVGAEYGGEDNDDKRPTIFYVEFDDDRALDKLKRLVEFVVSQDVTRSYTPQEISAIKLEYPTALVDALELGVVSDSTEETDIVADDTDDYSLVVIIIITVAILWILDE